MIHPRILILDLNAVLHGIKYRIGKGRMTKADEKTFIIYGFLFKLNALIHKSKAQIVVYALDSQSSKRKQLYALYKENRTEDNKTEDQKRLDALAYPQFDEIVNYVLPTLGCMNVFGEDGFEADDVIGRICRSYKDNQIVICTTDHDLYQLLTPNVCILNAKTDAFFSITTFKKTYGIEPKMWKRVKAIGGCTSDNVKGVPIPQSDPTKKMRHVAETGALNYLKGKTKSTTQAYKAIVSRAGRNVINRNKALVILPFRGTPEYKIRPDRMSKKGLIRIAEKHDFATIKNDITFWTKALKLR